MSRDILEYSSDAAKQGNDGNVIRLLDADPSLLERCGNEIKRPLASAVEYRQLCMMRKGQSRQPEPRLIP